MKRVINVIFLMSVLLFFSFNTYAIEMVINVEGTVNNNTSDVLGWSGEPFTIFYTIDSEKSPYFSDLWYDSGSYLHSIDSYHPDSAVFTVGGVNQSIDEANLTLFKSEAWPTDMITVQLQNVSEGWFLESDLQLDFCDLGNPPLPASTLFSLDDGEIYSAEVITYPPGDPYSVLYGLSVTEFKSNPVPEPTTMLLLGSGLVGLAGFGRKKFKK